MATTGACRRAKKLAAGLPFYARAFRWVLLGWSVVLVLVVVLNNVLAYTTFEPWGFGHFTLAEGPGAENPDFSSKILYFAGDLVLGMIFIWGPFGGWSPIMALRKRRSNGLTWLGSAAPFAQRQNSKTGTSAPAFVADLVVPLAIVALISLLVLALTLLPSPISESREAPGSATTVGSTHWVSWTSGFRTDSARRCEIMGSGEYSCVVTREKLGR
jgi:hypothetical protein